MKKFHLILGGWYRNYVEFQKLKQIGLEDVENANFRAKNTNCVVGAAHVQTFLSFSFKTYRIHCTILYLGINQLLTNLFSLVAMISKLDVES